MESRHLEKVLSSQILLRNPPQGLLSTKGVATGCFGWSSVAPQNLFGGFVAAVRLDPVIRKPVLQELCHIGAGFFPAIVGTM